MKKTRKPFEEFENLKLKSMHLVHGGSAEDPGEGDDKPKPPPPPPGPLGPIIKK